MEPVQGEGGVTSASPSFLAALRTKCSASGALLIFDEVQCGLGRTGTVFAHQHPSFKQPKSTNTSSKPKYSTASNASTLFTTTRPDILTLAKPLANGIPIGAVVLSSKVAPSIVPGDHGTTFGGSPFATAVGNVVMKRLCSSDLLTLTVPKASAHLVETLQGLTRLTLL